MEKIQANHNMIELIRSKYIEKRAQNPHYSLSAYARDLGVSPSFLSRLLRGERPLTAKQCVQIAAILGLSQEKTEEYLANSTRSKKVKEALAKRSNANLPNVQYFEVEKFKAISQWYHLAIINLTFVKSFKPTAAWIALRLGISRLEAQDALDRLLRLGLLQKKGSTLVPTDNMLFVNTKKSELSVREFHKALSLKAIDVLNESSQAAFDQRYIGGVTFAVDVNRIEAFKEELKKFQLKIMGMTTSDSYSDVYQLNLQLFPLTKPETKL